MRLGVLFAVPLSGWVILLDNKFDLFKCFAEIFRKILFPLILMCSGSIPADEKSLVLIVDFMYLNLQKG